MKKELEVRTLDHSSFEEVVEVFRGSFAGYAVPMPVEPSFYQNKWRSVGVLFDHSYGMYDGEKLVGFILHGVRKVNGVVFAYNTGTGVLPEFRGQRIVQQMYNRAIPELKQKGVAKSILEVLVDNKIAIRAYQKAGFSIDRTFHCFKGELPPASGAPIDLVEVNGKDLKWEELPNQNKYGWSAMAATILLTESRYFKVLHAGVPTSFFVLQKKGRLAQIEVFENTERAWKGLFEGIRKLTPSMDIINVDAGLTEKLNWLKSLGLENHVDQYEMSLSL